MRILHEESLKCISGGVDLYIANRDGDILGTVEVGQGIDMQRLMSRLQARDLHFAGVASVGGPA